MEGSDTQETIPGKTIESLHEVIKTIAKGRNYNIQIEPGSAKGDNYLGIVYRINVTIDNNIINNNNNSTEINQNKIEKLSIILKLPPQNEIRRKQFFARSSFLREALAYNEILPMFMEFQKQKGVNPCENGFHEIPKCYAALTEDCFEAILLEDLRVKDFNMFNRFDKVTADYVLLVMKLLGKLHAISFAIKDQCPEKIAPYQGLKDLFEEREQDEVLITYFDSLKTRALETLNPDQDPPELIEKFNKFLGNVSLYSVIIELIKGKAAEPYAVLCHGDSWNNNILFKIKNGKPVDARLIDWQILRYASPVNDLMYYIFACTTKALRDQYYETFLDTYYKELTTLLTRLGSDPEKVYPRNAFNDQLKKFGRFGFIMATMILPVITTHGEDVPDLDELSAKLEAGNLDPNETFTAEKSVAAYKERMRDVIIDMDRLGYI